MHNFFPFPQLSWVEMRKIKVRNTKNNIFPPRIGLPKRTGQEDKEDKRRIGTHLKTKGKKTHLQHVNSIWKSCPKETGKIQQWPIFVAKYRELNSGLRLWYRIVYIIAESLSYWVFYNGSFTYWLCNILSYLQGFEDDFSVRAARQVKHAKTFANDKKMIRWILQRSDARVFVPGCTRPISNW